MSAKMIRNHALSLTLWLGAWACGGPHTLNLTPSANQDVVEKIPDWLLKQPTNKEHLYVLAPATSRDLQVAMQKARINAQADLKQQLDNRLANLSMQFQEETGLGEDSAMLSQFLTATKSITKQTLQGARVEQQRVLPEKDIYPAYVLRRLPLGQANQLMM
ncbi:MAG: LPP20 family lipoprotein [Candidatus Handelsmanbacteria bacterium]|nr:LPP20 family lipoprotein [Candidatus Handelsmanbacteria bacterium]